MRDWFERLSAPIAIAIVVAVLMAMIIVVAIIGYQVYPIMNLAGGTQVQPASSPAQSQSPEDAPGVTPWQNPAPWANSSDSSGAPISPRQEKKTSFDVGWTLGGVVWWIFWKALAWLAWAWIGNGISKVFANAHADNLADWLNTPWEAVRSMTDRGIVGPQHSWWQWSIIEGLHLCLVFFVGNPVLWALAIPFVAFGALKLVSFFGGPFLKWLGLPWDRLMPWLFALAKPRFDAMAKKVSGEKGSPPDELESARKQADLARATFEAKMYENALKGDQDALRWVLASSRKGKKSSNKDKE